MQLRVSDPGYTERLVNFLRSLGQAVTAAGPGRLQVDIPSTEDALVELGIYLRVWKVLYPDADVHVENADGDELPAA
jgi:hypothetical protein